MLGLLSCSHPRQPNGENYGQGPRGYDAGQKVKSNCHCNEKSGWLFHKASPGGGPEPPPRPSSCLPSWKQISMVQRAPVRYARRAGHAARAGLRATVPWDLAIVHHPDQAPASRSGCRGGWGRALSLAEPAAVPEQELRGLGQNLGNLNPNRQDRSHAASPGSQLPFLTPLSRIMC